MCTSVKHTSYIHKHSAMWRCQFVWLLIIMSAKNVIDSFQSLLCIIVLFSRDKECAHYKIKLFNCSSIWKIRFSDDKFGLFWPICLDSEGQLRLCRNGSHSFNYSGLLLYTSVFVVPDILVKNIY